MDDFMVVRFDRVPLDPRRLILQATYADSAALIGALAQGLAMADGVSEQVSVEALTAALEERLTEERPSAQGVLILPVRIPGLTGVRLCLVSLARPLQGSWAVPLAGVVAVAMPLEAPAVGLRVLDQLGGLLQDPRSLAHLLGSRSEVDLARWLERRLVEDDGPLLAAEMMRAPLVRVYADTPLTTITRLMVAHNLEAVSILEADGRVVGMLLSEDLLTFGLPDFFKQLKSVSFIAEFDPFRGYFARERDLVARDLMHTEVPTVKATDTALEVVFLLAVRRYPKVWVVDDQGVLMGVIDRIRVIDRILNL